MSVLSLVAPPAILTKTVKIPDPTNPQATVLQSYPCDVDGAQLGPNDAPTLLYRDLASGKTFARVIEKIPSSATTAGAAIALAVTALKPIHFANGDGSINGWFVPAPDFNGREATSESAE